MEKGSTMINGKTPLKGKRIGIVGKGGSGKSTLTILLASALKDQDYHVCLLDADSTNLGLAKVLGFERSPAPLLEYYGGMVFSGGAVTCPVDDPTLLPMSDISIDMLPPEYYVQQDRITFLTAGKIGEMGPGAGCDGPVSKIARDIKIHDRDQAIITLVDFKAGFEDSARGAITSLDWVVMVIDPTLASIEMAIEMRNMVKRIQAGELPATMHLNDPNLVKVANHIYQKSKLKGVIFVLNNVQNAGMENYLHMELSKHNITPIGVIHRDPAIQQAWLKAVPIEAEKPKQEAVKVARALEAAEALIDDRENNSHRSGHEPGN
jgi:CO dehydrogenase maturation factor